MRCLNLYVITNYEIINGILSVGARVALVTRFAVDAGLRLDEMVRAAPRSPSSGSLFWLRVVLDIGVHAASASHWSNVFLVG